MIQQKGPFNPYLTRPARRQVPKGSGPPRAEFTHHSSEYNIWYGKKLGDRFTKDDRIKAGTRCCLSTDAGYTRADVTGKSSYCCLYFARGHCMNGAECTFYHRAPTEEDEKRIDLAHDIFGRERHRTYREDMGGVGSFTRDNKTLYITGFKRAANTDEVIKRHFAEWGDMENVRIVWDKQIGFVKYRLRSMAEFAKEAMTDQSLDGDEILSIRWSNEDPNPQAQAKEDEKILAQYAKMASDKQKELEPLYQYEAGDGGAQDNFPSEYNPSQYPNTDTQYTGSDYSNSSKIVSEWLKQIAMDEYTDSFLSAGYFDYQSLSQLDEISLDAIGVTVEDHRKAILGASSNLLQYLEQYYAAQHLGYYPGYDQYYDPQQQEYTYSTNNEEYEDQQPPSVGSSNAPLSGTKRATQEEPSSAVEHKKQKPETPKASLVDYDDDEDQ